MSARRFGVGRTPAVGAGIAVGRRARPRESAAFGLLLMLTGGSSTPLRAQSRVVSFEASEPRFEEAAEKYAALWTAEGERIVRTLEEVSGLGFALDSVHVLVMDGPSWAGSGRMGMRADYPPDTKRATLVHELGHLLLGNRVPTDSSGEPVVEPHRILFLFLYDVWVELWGAEFADRQVAVESARRGGVDYEGTWGEVLARDAEARATELRELLARWSASPTALAGRVLEAFARGDTARFGELYPFEDGRELLAWAVDEGHPIVPGLARTLHVTGDSAVVLLSGHVEFGNTGDETSTSRGFSDLYLARRAGDGWTLAERLSLGIASRISRQVLDVRLTPGEGLEVTDTLTIGVHRSLGFVARLNHAARLRGVEVDGDRAGVEFGGGLLWVDAPPGEHRVTLRYEIDVSADSAQARNSGWFGPRFGHVRNQYFWHPFYDFQSEAQLGAFSLRVRAPVSHHVATDLPQTESIRDGERMVMAASREPVFALSLFYDADWTPLEREAAGFRLAIFGDTTFTPEPDSLAFAFRRVYDVIEGRLGAPTGGYMAIVQARARSGSGWLFRSNDAIVTPEGGGGSTSRGGPWPRAWFGHEIAHGWTRPTGRAANLLREGWATFAEALLLEAEYGAETARSFWEVERSLYLIQGHDGTRTLLNDPSNSGIAYYKGAWLLRMLEEELGEAAFGRGMADYMAIEPGRAAGIEEFVDALSRAAGRDVTSFLRPWLEETTIPDVRASFQEGKVILGQTGPVFTLPLTLELIADGDTLRRRVRLTDRRQEFAFSGLGAIESVRPDPDHRLLMRRHCGERVTFRTEAPGASDVELDGSFTPEAIPARREGKDWIVEIPLTDGRYAFWWTVDGEFAGLDSVAVECRAPAGRESYPRPGG